MQTDRMASYFLGGLVELHRAVDTDADDRIAHQTDRLGTDRLGLDQDPADLSILDKHIVRPLDLGLRSDQGFEALRFRISIEEHARGFSIGPIFCTALTVESYICAGI